MNELLKKINYHLSNLNNKYQVFSIDITKDNTVLVFQFTSLIVMAGALALFFRLFIFEYFGSWLLVLWVFVILIWIKICYDGLKLIYKAKQKGMFVKCESFFSVKNKIEVVLDNNALKSKPNNNNDRDKIISTSVNTDDTNDNDEYIADSADTYSYINKSAENSRTAKTKNKSGAKKPTTAALKSDVAKINRAKKTKSKPNATTTQFNTKAVAKKTTSRKNIKDK